MKITSDEAENTYQKCIEIYGSCLCKETKKGPCENVDFPEEPSVKLAKAQAEYRILQAVYDLSDEQQRLIISMISNQIYRQPASKMYRVLRTSEPPFRKATVDNLVKKQVVSLHETNDCTYGELTSMGLSMAKVALKKSQT